MPFVFDGIEAQDEPFLFGIAADRRDGVVNFHSRTLLF